MEIWDLYDKNHNKLNMTIKKGDVIPKDTYRLVASICIFNENGEMLISQRQNNDRVFSGYYELTVSGGAIHDETSEMAIKREAIEELGLDISNENLRPALTVHFEKGFNDIFILHKNVDITSLELGIDEVQNVKWASKEEIIDMLKNNQFLPYYESSIQLIFDMKDSGDIRSRNK